MNKAQPDNTTELYSINELSPEEREAAIARLEAVQKRYLYFFIGLGVATNLCFFAFSYLKGQKIWISADVAIACLCVLGVLFPVVFGCCVRLNPTNKQLEKLKKNRS